MNRSRRVAKGNSMRVTTLDFPERSEAWIEHERVQSMICILQKRIIIHAGPAHTDEALSKAIGSAEDRTGSTI